MTGRCPAPHHSGAKAQYPSFHSLSPDLKKQVASQGHLVYDVH
ncbi:hypothetical protein RR42_s1910 [Cupriavidus basilensis]|uniref:Uncharacterized protein n=1 Tax=Cupriavidus basilensis TaxID=68895 RepID=A0A0C4YKA4_9BURK|nr:hypothetical protein RR42_s1910 [Cupriavidus basilensis]